MAGASHSKCDILIVDDDPRVLLAFSNYLEGTGLKTRFVGPADSARSESVFVDILADAITAAEKYSPRAATIDYDLGSDGRGGRYTGNQIGKALLEACPSIRLAGITGGKSEDFNASLFQIRAHKAVVTQDSYRALCGFLLSSSNPATEYNKWCSEHENLSEVFAAMSVIAQGYNLSKRVQKGEQPVCGMVLACRSDAELRALLAMIAEPEFASARVKVSDDEVLRSLMFAIEKNLVVEDASVLLLEERLKKMLGDDTNG